ncbi:MAG: protocatechuate 3,4-dioxygenase subunit alpha [Rhodospirillaceae bacterium]|jgi:protocatechuate 3,4-dioxygenase alpha subunit|nr:protocatechuate 3,4-dioxygenase subunit alpha [Rhodospirillaceae bacterium]MBT4046234.1 protocatechuate 3,4-dioxygenase subunit alpha [Rhodospirillaceae bacterium]MBT4688335.1 protocatechuate 3,4-dioxygenase subunit alpha [Rhodospirillaceae bacterium]MBT5080047.1 protocatechuate 3,4-dioxygenase subunit alpha [Rhodospirillaceae bacterium]MBT5525636.1 protocatechuate 3,4-dioxygenase subunit alpha [Rhodospirillaceae bacterium]
MARDDKLRQTPSQTVGPYFAYGLTPEQYGYDYKQLVGNNLSAGDIAGERIAIRGQVFDGNGDTVRDAVLELWQADSQGRYAHPEDERGSNTGFAGFGRVGTGTLAEHFYEFQTIKPGAIGDGQAPHITVVVFMRGLLNHVYTRIYFSDEAAANDGDPVLAQIDPARRNTLIAQRQDGPDDADGADGAIYRFDIHMQGDQETVFFDA